MHPPNCGHLSELPRAGSAASRTTHLAWPCAAMALSGPSRARAHNHLAGGVALSSRWEAVTRLPPTGFPPAHASLAALSRDRRRSA